MTNRFNHLFSNKKPLIACIHLQALPGAPLYQGNVEAVYEKAIAEAMRFNQYGVDGLIIENFGDKPFFPDSVCAETIAAMAVVSREITQKVNIPIGINVLRNDALSAMAIASTTGADFIRVNTHTGAVVTDQGLIQGLSHQTLRLRQQLQSDVAIFADVGVKHAMPLADRGLAMEADDLANRGLVDALIVSGTLTGQETSVEDITTVKNQVDMPLLIGSGTTIDNLENSYPLVNGYIVGSTFKKAGKASNGVDEDRLKSFMNVYRSKA